MAIDQILIDVVAERSRQDEKWGGPEHDDSHSTAEFVQLIEDYAGWARTMSGMSNPGKARRRLIQVAALAVAAVESLGEKKRRQKPRGGIKMSIAEYFQFLSTALKSEAQG